MSEAKGKFRTWRQHQLDAEGGGVVRVIELAEDVGGVEIVVAARHDGAGDLTKTTIRLTAREWEALCELRYSVRCYEPEAAVATVAETLPADVKPWSDA